MEHTDSLRDVEGFFDGQNLVGEDGAIYPVYPNYASKSKLIEGDRLRLTITTSGQFIFKQVQPTQRRRTIGTVVLRPQHRHCEILADDTYYDVLEASLRYYRLQVGDEVTIILPMNAESRWAAIENAIRYNTTHTDAELSEH